MKKSGFSGHGNSQADILTVLINPAWRDSQQFPTPHMDTNKIILQNAAGFSSSPLTHT